MNKNLNEAVIMVVDDTPENLILLIDILNKNNYKIKAFPNGKMAVASAIKNPPDLILLDIMMPDMNGYEVCKLLKKDERFSNVPILFISALSASFDKVKAFEAGGVDYISKPFDTNEIDVRIKAHLTIRFQQLEIEEYNNKLEKIVSEQVKEITEGQLATINAMTKLGEVRDDDTGKHIERTKNFCKLLSQAIKKDSKYSNLIDDEFIENIYNASPLHDIGKIAIPDNILLKPARLSPEEFEIMKTHASIGKKYLEEACLHFKSNAFLKLGIEIAGYHHEKWDGSGYPNGLLGEAIPLSARIMAVADVYDALRSKRVYKEAYSHEKSVKIIVDGKGKHFDPTVVDSLISIEKEFEKVYLALNDGTEE